MRALIDLKDLQLSALKELSVKTRLSRAELIRRTVNDYCIRNTGHLPKDEEATKLIWLALRNITASWKNPPIAWAAAKAQFAIQFSNRFRLDV
jgi:transposase-like protein